ncbi:hypothetical protein [Aureitalea marina]|uniref:Uncharacterized protein n=1 Tax=Aureitalea marina TaxID=930804 RepID=A0A2S7KPL4_9FLAO|nr:hypothetical protein [Aureitalea marina]PQB04574.1 hypothetical protein BST85_06420 [Aureitalea marina]
MELVKIETLLDKYFEGQTSLQEEQQLSSYFTGKDVDPSLAAYVPMFQGFEQARTEQSQQELELPQITRSNRNWWYGIAATLVVGLGIASFMLGGANGLTAEEQEALAAYEQARSSLILLSQSMNKGTESIAYLGEIDRVQAPLTHLGEFEKGQAHLARLNEFSSATNKVLK